MTGNYQESMLWILKITYMYSGFIYLKGQKIQMLQKAAYILIVANGNLKG